jgi:hypothetical protein
VNKKITNLLFLAMSLQATVIAECQSPPAVISGVPHEPGMRGSKVVSFPTTLTIGGLNPNHNGVQKEPVSSIEMQCGILTILTNQSKVTISPFPLPVNIFNNRKLVMEGMALQWPTGIISRVNLMESGKLFMHFVCHAPRGSYVNVFRIEPGEVAARLVEGHLRSAGVSIVSPDGTTKRVNPGQTVDLLSEEGNWNFFLVGASALVPGDNPGLAVEAQEFSADCILYRKR